MGDRRAGALVRRPLAVLAALGLLACGGACGLQLAPRGADVAAACARLRALGCDSGKPTPGGATCEDVIRASSAAGVVYDLHCLAKLSTCAGEPKCSKW